MVDETEAIRIRLQFESEQAEKRGKSMERQLVALERRFDPLASATLKFDRGVKLLEKSLEAGKIDAARYEKGLENLNREFDAAKVKAAGMANVMAQAKVPAGTMAKFVDKNRFALQQAGYQFGDFAVQVQGGTSAVTAFTQQGTQMLGVFGAYGAIAGAALAIGTPLIASFMGSREASVEFKDSLSDLIEKVGAYEAAVANANVKTDDLRAKYGEASEAARVFLTTLESIAGVEAVNALNSAMLRLSETFGDFGFEDSGFSNYETTLRMLRKELDLTGEASVEVARGLEAMANASGAEEQANAASVLLAILEDTLGPFDGMNEAAQELYKQIATVGDQAALLSGEIENSETSMLDMVAAIYSASGGLDGAIVRANNLAGAIAVAARTAWDYAGAMGAARMASLRQLDEMKTEFSPGGQARKKYAGRGETSETPITDGRGFILKDGTFVDPNAKPVRRSSSSRKAGGGKSSGSSTKNVADIFVASERDLVNLERQIELIGKSKSEVAGLTAKHRLLDGAKKQGLALDKEHAKSGKTLGQVIDEQAASVGRLTGELERGEASQQRFEGAIEDLADAFTDAIFEGESLRESFQNILKGIAKDIVNSGIRNLLVGQFQAPTGGLLSGLFGGGSNATTAPTGGGLLSGLLGGGGTGGGLLGKIFGGGAAKSGGLLSGLFGGSGASAASGGGLFSGLLGGGGGALGALGAAVPWIGAGAALLSGFKKKTEVLDEGLSVDVSGKSSSVHSYRNVKETRFWGLSKKNRTEINAASQAIQDSVATSVADLRTNVLDAASALGVGSNAFEGFSRKIKLSTKDMTEEQAIEALTSELEGLQDQFALAALGTSEFTHDAETASQALERISGALGGVNPLLEQLGLTLFDVSVAGGAAASQFADLLGGVDAAGSAAASYFDAFYSDAEKLDHLKKTVREVMRSLGVNGLPDSLEAFRDALEAYDSAGDKEAVARLLQIAPIFKEIADQGVSAAEAAKRLADELVSGVGPEPFSNNADYQRAVVAARAEGKKAIDAAKASSSVSPEESKDFANKVGSAIDNRKADAEIDRLTEAAKALGPRPEEIGIAYENLNDRMTSHMRLSDGTKLTDDQLGHKASWYGLRAKANPIMNRRKAEIASWEAKIEALRDKVRAQGGVPSFSGGGWTGSGIRAGGLDGQGGFPALLHPQELVLDAHKIGRGSSRAGSVLGGDGDGLAARILDEIQMLRSSASISAHQLVKIADDTDELVALEQEAQS
ncbi:hypothetical protein [Planktotalea sp.]|uniref:hypothetical protein n=1 Tax=Planktotalea sp. TaxID=2029877 RepID=UPI003D6B3F3B